ncbi:unnamed protein product [Lampetra planeri]
MPRGLCTVGAWKKSAQANDAGYQSRCEATSARGSGRGRRFVALEDNVAAAAVGTWNPRCCCGSGGQGRSFGPEGPAEADGKKRCGVGG